jgi:multidrug efflux pump
LEFIGFKFLGVRDYPAIDPPNINVRTSYGGANPDIIETQITEPLEKAINGIAGIKNHLIQQFRLQQYQC